MNRDDIIRMAGEAGMYVTTRKSTFDAMLERFAALIASAEREACARVAERSESAEHCAASIRARGQA